MHLSSHHKQKNTFERVPSFNNDVRYLSLGTLNFGGAALFTKLIIEPK